MFAFMRYEHDWWQGKSINFVKSNENTYPKGRALMQMYRVVPIRGMGLTETKLG